MKAAMQMAETTLRSLLAGHAFAVGLDIRVHGDHLILSRQEPAGPNDEMQRF